MRGGARAGLFVEVDLLTNDTGQQCVPCFVIKVVGESSSEVQDLGFRRFKNAVQTTKHDEGKDDLAIL
jgi:hypothetical protein